MGGCVRACVDGDCAADTPSTRRVDEGGGG